MVEVLSKRLRATRRLLGAASVLLLVLGGCTNRPADPTATRTFTDDLDRTVTIRQPVARVLTLAPSLTEVVYAAGGGAQVVGVSTVDTYPPAAMDLPRYGLFPIDYTALAALDPHLVLATPQVNAPRDAETLAALGIPTVFIEGASLDAMLRSIRLVGDLLGTAAAAAASVDSLQRRIDQLRARTDTLTARPLVLFLVGDDQLFAFGQGSYVHDLIALAGGRSATAEIETEAPVLSEAFVLQTQPEVIVGGFGTDYDPAELLALHPTWDIVPAIQAGRVYSFDPDLFYRSGPRLVEGAWQLARRLHPALFRDEPEAAP